MKNSKNFQFQLLLLLNIIFWTGWIYLETSEYHYRAEHYARMEILKKQGTYNAYIEDSAKDPVLRATPVPQERIEKYTWWFCLRITLGLFLPFIFLIYTNWLFLIPRFLAQKKYLKYTLGLVLMLLVVSFALSFHSIFSGESVLVKEENEKMYFIFSAMMEAFGGSMMALFVSTPVFLSYNWFTQQNKIHRLENERLNTELALLKSQINPHFFFNTLNNLYALTLGNSKLASDVILKLSEVMRYTIYEGRDEKVEIQKEVVCLKNYMSLQKIRAHKKVTLIFKNEIENEKLEVPPLLFLSFLENAFKHGVDTLRNDAFVDMNLISNREELTFNLTNNYDPEERQTGANTGLKNTIRRLNLLYPNQQHSLEIKDKNAVFHINLKIYFS